MRVNDLGFAPVASRALLLGAILILASPATILMAQPEPTVPVEALPPAAQVETTPSAETYSYDPAGRRDPFLSLLARGVETLPAGDRPEGLAGLLINEIALRGIVRSRGAYVAILQQAPSGRTFLAREGDQVLDGSVRTITPEAVIFMQVVNDPLSLVSEREVRKPLRSQEEGR